MLGRLYAFLFLAFLVCAFWYQRHYLKRSEKAFDAELKAQGQVLPVATVNQFAQNSYQNGRLASTFVGDSLVYYTDRHFVATGHLVYRQFDLLTGKETLAIFTDKAIGQTTQATSEGNDSAFLSGGEQKLVSLFLPGQVNFSFLKNHGQTSEVFFDALSDVLRSGQLFSLKGPAGNLQGKGFSYSLRDESFHILSETQGMVDPSNLLQKKNNQGNGAAK